MEQQYKVYRESQITEMKQNLVKIQALITNPYWESARKEKIYKLAQTVENQLAGWTTISEAQRERGQ